MKRKLIKILSGVVVSALVLAGCAGNTGSVGGASPSASGTAAATNGASGTGNTIVGENGRTNMALVVNSNLGDNAFSDLVWSGVKKAAQDQKDSAIAIELMGDATKQEPTLTELCESKKYNVIVSGTFNLKEALQEAAAKYPDQKFIVYDTQVDFDKGDYKNCISVMSKQNEGSFLAGALAAIMTTQDTEYTNPEKIIGFVAGNENSAINDFLIGYIEGAKYIDPDIKVLYSYIGDFKNTAKAKELALAQYNQGADIVFEVASSAGLGVFDAAKDQKKLAIGVDLDQAMIVEKSDPEMASLIMTSVVKNLDKVIYDKIKEFDEGTIEWGTHKAAGLKEGGMSLADNKYYQAIVPENVRAQIAEITKKVVDGEINVSTAIGMSTEEVKQFKDWASREGAK